MKKNIAILAGGNSSEYEISMLSAQNVYKNIDREKYVPYLVEIKGVEWKVLIGEKAVPFDITSFSFALDGKKITFNFAFIAVHGTPGEDGLLQGYLEMLNIPYSSSDVLSSSLSFNKYKCNRFLQSYGIKVADFYRVFKGQSYDYEKIVEKIGLPCFVKPTESGSSFGITKVKKAEDLKSAIDYAYTEGSEVMIESFIDGTELSCGVLKTKAKEIVLPVAEIRFKSEFFDYEAKYFSKATEEIAPAPIPNELSERVQKLSSDIYDLLGCRGIVRVDFIVRNDEIYFLELNTIPGITKMSIITNEIKATSWTFKEILNLIIEDLSN